MDTINRAASAASEVIFGEHGHEHTGTGTDTNPASTETDTGTATEETHEPLSGTMGETAKGEPYDAGNLGDETSQQRIAASRGKTGETHKTGSSATTGTTDSSGPYTIGGSSLSNPAATTGDTATTTHPDPGEPRRSSDVSPRSGPPATPTGYPAHSTKTTTGREGTGAGGTGSYSSARETAARATSSAETGGAGAAEHGAGTGMWSKDDRGKRDEKERVDEGVAGVNEEETGQKEHPHAKFRGSKAADNDDDAADAVPSRAPAPGGQAGVRDATEDTTSGASGTGAGGSSRPGEGASGGEPLGRHESLTGNVPGTAGGEGMRRTSGGAGQGTGEKWVKSSGMKADGGDFDASAPGAGREADRLLTEKGVSHGESAEDKYASASKEQTDTKAPTEGAEKVGVKDKIKMKLHKA